MLDPATLARFRALKPGMELTLIRRYRQPIEKVFAALSTPERIADWMGVTWQGDDAPLTVGKSFSYTFGDTDMASMGHVTAYDPPHVIEHSWFENIPPAATVRWALEPDGAGCVLTLTQSFPGKDDATRNGAGWTMIMGQLDAWLDGEPFQPAESWRQVRDRLVGELGPEAVRDGRKFEVDGRPVVQFKRVVPTPVPELWAWLVEPTKLKHWLGDVDVELRPGGAYRVRFEMAPVTMDGTITEVDPPRLLALIWREPWFKTDEVILQFDLEPYGEGATLFTLTHTFPAGFDAHDYLAGWHDYLDVIEDAIQGRALAWGSPERKQAYATREQVYKAIAGAEGGNK